MEERQEQREFGAIYGVEEGSEMRSSKHDGE